MSITTESVIVITGAASGIGRALALRFAREEIAGIAISDINEEGLQETARMIKEPGPKVSIHCVNVAKELEMRAFVGDVVREHGRATHVINNAGVALGGTVSDVSLEDIRWLMDVNFWGVVHGTKLFLPVLLKEKSAHIVNISSLFGLIAPPGQAPYAASKFAVRGFTEALRHELEGTNIDVSVVHPGGVQTNIANSARVGEFVTLSQEEIQKEIDKTNRDLSRTSPDIAADTIVRGIKARKSRILVGNDARLLGLVPRLFPSRYFSIIDLITGGSLSPDKRDTDK